MVNTDDEYLSVSHEVQISGQNEFSLYKIIYINCLFGKQKATHSNIKFVFFLSQIYILYTYVYTYVYVLKFPFQSSFCGVCAAEQIT